MEYNEAVARASTRGSLIWHYTTLDALERILATNSLLATDVYFQNDTHETETADQALEAALSSIGERPEYAAFVRSFRESLQGPPRRDERDQGESELALSRFVLCASNDPDSLYLWRSYAREPSIGCAVGLDPNSPLGVLLPADPHLLTKKRRGLSVHAWTPVNYDFDGVVRSVTSDLVSIADRYNDLRRGPTKEDAEHADQIMMREGFGLQSDIRTFAKHAAFAGEQEMRLTVEDVNAWPALVFTPSGMGPRPHIRLVAGTRWGRPVEPADTPMLLPIRAVRLGPNAPHIAERSLKWLLLANGYPIADTLDDNDQETWDQTVVVSRSVHPFRSI